MKRNDENFNDGYISTFATTCDVIYYCDKRAVRIVIKIF